MFSDTDHTNRETKSPFTEKKFTLNIHEGCTATEHLSNNLLIYYRFLENDLEWQVMTDYIIKLSCQIPSIPCLILKQK